VLARRRTIWGIAIMQRWRRQVCEVLAGLMKEAASVGGLNTPTLPTNYLPRATPSFCMTCAITEKPRAIAIVTVQKVNHMG